jgi:ABC-type molybdate transport system substrate-binding protein
LTSPVAYPPQDESAFVFVVVQGVRLTLPIAAQSKTITVFAAASMKNALDDINETFTTRTCCAKIPSRPFSIA